MTRVDRRSPDQMRPVTITRNYIKHPEGSVLISVGDTKVICTASVDERQPRFMREQQIPSPRGATFVKTLLQRQVGRSGRCGL